MKENHLDINELYVTYKAYFIAIAYKMLGSISDAEDIVQDTFLKLQMSEVHLTDINNIKSYVSRMVVNRCINELQSSRKKRETYVGTWLPEPIVQDTKWDPSEKIIQDDQLYYTFVVLMEKLSATERAVYVLKESLDLKHSEIADLLNITEMNCRKVFSRAKKKMNVSFDENSTSYEIQQEQIHKFISALSRGNVQEISAILTSDVTLIADGGGNVATAINQILSKERVLSLLSAIATKFFTGKTARAVIVNNEPGVLIVKDEEVVGVFSFAWKQNTNQIEQIFYVVNPDKLGHIIIQQ
ncbi:sigma-70 family RNA polymerase sigma factor [Bacillus cytotoxicus]|uniref:Sigma-70 family RNA polymerase sigma factor n=1 Tax=Bacillus cytotoxicus TaxID=580165 RepID=A0ACC6A8X7_9BACI|nr:sigma-70 family RNA polymerase sigma factor [Bacillus cytotoxicus]